MSYKWTEEMDEYLKILAKNKKESYGSMAKKMGLTHYVIRERIKKLNIEYTIKHGQQNDWSEEEIINLKQLANEGILTGREIGLKLNRPTKQIYSRMAALGITYLSKNCKTKPWSEEDIEWIKTNSEKYTVFDAAKILNRTPLSIRKIYKKKNLKFKQYEFFDDEKKKEILCCYKRVGTIGKTSKETNYTPNCIMEVLKSSGVDTSNPKTKWKEIRDNIIKDHDENVLSLSEMKIKYSYSGICKKLKDEGIHNPERKYLFRNKKTKGVGFYPKWKPEEESWMKENYSKEGLTRSALILNRTQKQILVRAKKLNLKIKPEDKRIPQSFHKRGICGYFKNDFFRSMKEFWFMYSLDVKLIKWENAEHLFSIPYIIDGKQKNYRPDFLVGDTLYEIKPRSQFSCPTVIAKKSAAIEFCKLRGLKYELIDQEVPKEEAKKLFLNGVFTVVPSCEARIKRYLKL